MIIATIANHVLIREAKAVKRDIISPVAIPSFYMFVQKLLLCGASLVVCVVCGKNIEE